MASYLGQRTCVTCRGRRHIGGYHDILMEQSFFQKTGGISNTYAYLHAYDSPHKAYHLYHVCA